MTTIQILNNHHFSFACEVVNGLNRFYNIPIEVSQRFEEDNYFNNDVRWAIVTISYLFRNDFFKIFSTLDKGLKNKKQFKEYCMLIPVRKNNRYFFNFLRRVSLIYEMAVYCYRNGYDYFLKARNCIAQYEDKQYFLSEGSWSSLTKTASFVRELGRPFLLVILEESTLGHPLNFSATVDRIERRLKMQNNTAILNSDEMSFLVEQKEKFIARERDDEAKKIDLQVEKEQTFSKSPESTLCASSMDSADEVNIMSEKKAIMDYLGSFLDPKVLNEIKNLSLESTKNESSNVSKPLEPLASRKSRTDTESTEEYDYLTADSASSSSKKLTADVHFRSKQSVDEHRKVAEGTHGSGDEYRIYPSSSGASYFPTPLNKGNMEKCKTGKPSQLEEDLYIPVSFSTDEKLQQHPGENPTVTGNCPLSVECGLYSSDESITSESQSSKKQVFPSDNTTCDLKLLQEDLYLSECSSEDEYAKQSSMKNETLRNKYLSPVKYGSCSSADSNTSKSHSPRKCIKSSEFKDSHLEVVEEDLYNPSTLNLSNFNISENPTSQQSILKKGESNSAMLESTYLSSASSITVDDLSSISEMLEESDAMLNFKIRSTLSIVSSALNVVSSWTGRHSEESQATTSKSLKPVTDTEAESSNKKSESDSDTTVKDSQTSSKPRQSGKGKDRRKKKGRKRK